MDAYALLHKKRETETHEKAREVAKVNEEIARTERQIETLKQYLKDTQRKTQERSLNGLYGGQIKNQLGFFQKINEGIQQQKLKLNMLQKQLVLSQSKFQTAVIEQNKIKKIIEIKTQQKLEHEGKIEQKMNDEFAMNSYFRKILKDRT